MESQGKRLSGSGLRSWTSQWRVLNLALEDRTCQLGGVSLPRQRRTSCVSLCPLLVPESSSFSTGLQRFSACLQKDQHSQSESPFAASWFRVYSPSGPESPCCQMFEKAEMKSVLFERKRQLLKELVEVDKTDKIVQFIKENFYYNLVAKVLWRCSLRGSVFNNQNAKVARYLFILFLSLRANKNDC